MYHKIGVSAPFNVQLNTTLYIFNLAVRSKEGKPFPVYEVTIKKWNDPTYLFSHNFTT